MKNGKDIQKDDWKVSKYCIVCLRYFDDGTNMCGDGICPECEAIDSVTYEKKVESVSA